MDAGTLELVELDTRLDFEHTPKCEVTRAGCDAEADLLQVNLCCGAACYSCLPHSRDLDKWVGSRASYRCHVCGAKTPGYEWKPIR